MLYMYAVTVSQTIVPLLRTTNILMLTIRQHITCASNVVKIDKILNGADILLIFISLFYVFIASIT